MTEEPQVRRTISFRASQIPPVFYERLSFLIRVNGLSFFDVSCSLRKIFPDCRISGRTVERWASEYSRYHVPNFRYLYGLCKVLHCSGSYLLGVDDVYHPTVKVRKIQNKNIQKG